mgnify:CR=1 FL=1
MESLALKYRPHKFEDLSEQEEIRVILKNQINTNTIKHGYLFTGPAGCGKTTSARIFANMINKGEGTPIELDAASNNSVDDIRKLIDDAQTKSLDSEYKVFIVDEVHMVTPQGFNAFLKTLEEPPAKSIFILCTTNPEKVPNTILSRVQRYNFQKISTEGIKNRLQFICESEGFEYEEDALWLLSKLAKGGMRDGITLLDKVSSYSQQIDSDTVLKALGVVDYDTMLKLNDSIFNKDKKQIITTIDTVYNSGIDLKQFITNYFEFILDINVYHIVNDKYEVAIPNNVIADIDTYGNYEFSVCNKLLDFLVALQTSIKYEHNPKSVIQAKFLLFEGE